MFAFPAAALHSIQYDALFLSVLLSGILSDTGDKIKVDDLLLARGLLNEHPAVANFSYDALDIAVIGSDGIDHALFSDKLLLQFLHCAVLLALLFTIQNMSDCCRSPLRCDPMDDHKNENGEQEQVSAIHQTLPSFQYCTARSRFYGLPPIKRR